MEMMWSMYQPGEGELFRPKTNKLRAMCPRAWAQKATHPKCIGERAPATTDVQTHAKGPRRKLDPPYPKGRDSERFVGEKEAQLSPPDG